MNRQWIVWILWISLAGFVFTDPIRLPQPITGIVKATRLNARVKPSPNSDVICQLSLGTQIVIHEVDGPWLGISIPSTTTGWIRQQYLLEDQVKNVASVHIGPGDLFSAFATIAPGTKVNIIERHGQWVQVNAPMEGRLWVHQDFVTLPEGIKLPNQSSEKISTPTGKQKLSPSSELIQPLSQPFPATPSSITSDGSSKFDVYRIDQVVPDLKALKPIGPSRPSTQEGIIVTMSSVAESNKEENMNLIYLLAVHIDSKYYPLVYLIPGSLHLHQYLGKRVLVKGELQWLDGISCPALFPQEITIISSSNSSIR